MANFLTLLEVIQKTTDFLATKGVESARLNAELIIGHALGLKRMQLYLQFERVLLEPELEKIRPLVKRRSQREPVQYIIGEIEWAGLKLKVDRRALIPRPETELLIELVVTRVGDAQPDRILDLGTGTGAIALALAKHFAGARVTAVDASSDALALAGENAQALGLQERVEFVRSDWFAALPEDARFHVVVSNPPYLSDEETAAAEPEVRAFEPLSALRSGNQGLADLRRIVEGAKKRLLPGGLLALETGIEHHAELKRSLAGHGFDGIESVQDLTQRDRFVFARVPSAS